jgi:DNA-binding NarL/FixJ family response regulator
VVVSTDRKAQALKRTIAIFELTPQETHVFARITLGLANKQISQQLGIAEGTVKAHTKSLLGKVGVTNRTQLAIVGTRLLVNDLPSLR